MEATPSAARTGRGPSRSRRTLLLAGAVLVWAAQAAAGDADLADAAEEAETARAHALVESGADPNVAQVDGMTALHWAALRDDLETARLLIDAGADPHAANRYGVTAMSLACTNGNGAIVELLLGAGADPDTVLPGGETALMTAARTGRLGPVRALLSHGASVDSKVHGFGRQEWAGANAFLARMADPTIFDFETRPEQTALTWAVAEGHAAVVEELIAAGAEFRTPMDSGFTPLLLAVRNGHLDVVRTLLAAGADPNRRIEPEPEWRHRGYGAKLRPGATPLHVAVENGHFELAVHLLDRGADVNAADPIGYAPLHAVPSARRVPAGDANPPPDPTGALTSLELVRILAARGADLDATMSGSGLINLGVAVPGPTALLAAVQTADLELVRTLVELGADPLLRDGSGRTALMLAGARMGSETEIRHTMELLLDLGVDIDAVDANEETAMHAAAYRDRPAPIMLLASRGADIDIWNRPNRHGATPLAIAVGHRGPRSFRPQPKAEAAIREVMLAAGVSPPRKVTVVRTGSRD